MSVCIPEKSFCSKVLGGQIVSQLLKEPGRCFFNSPIHTFNNSLLLLFDVSKSQAFGLFCFIDEPRVCGNTPTCPFPLGNQCWPVNQNQINHVLLIHPSGNYSFSYSQNNSVNGLLPSSTTKTTAEIGSDILNECSVLGCTPKHICIKHVSFCLLSSEPHSTTKCSKKHLFTQFVF